MCCLFGIIDYRHSLSAKQKNRVLSALATAAEVRGTDATGIAYNSGGKLRIYKRPWPAHLMYFRVPDDARVIMGHTRMTTQGSARHPYNNHPFPGSVNTGPFALAHNGVLYNDEDLRISRSLPQTKVETDSYIAVQLIEQKKTLDFSSLKTVAESVRGSFVFTVLDSNDALFVVKGDNPMCIYHDASSGVYLYASTEEILKRALSKVRLPLKHPASIKISCGDILRIDPSGNLTWQRFDDSKLLTDWYSPLWRSYYAPCKANHTNSHLDELKSVAMAFGYEPENIDLLAAQGFTADEIEEFFYGGEL